MTNPALNGVITDSMTAANTKVLGIAPSISLSAMFRTTCQALADAALNATSNQKNAYVVGQAAATEAIATMMSVDTAVTGLFAKKALDGTDSHTAAPPPPGASTQTVAANKVDTAAPVAPEPAVAVATDGLAANFGEELATAAHHAVKDSSDPMLMLMVLDAGALAIFDAVAHLSRVSMIAEAASAQALTRALAMPDGDAWQQVIKAADSSIDRAHDHLNRVATVVISLTRQARLAGSTEPQTLALANSQDAGLKIEPSPLGSPAAPVQVASQPQAAVSAVDP